MNCEITSGKIKEFQKEFGIRGAVKIMCILHELPLDIVRSGAEMKDFVAEKEKQDKLNAAKIGDIVEL
jgi:hypothetical protein